MAWQVHRYMTLLLLLDCDLCFKVMHVNKLLYWCAWHSRHRFLSTFVQTDLTLQNLLCVYAQRISS